MLLRKFVETHTMRFRSAVIRAIAHRKKLCTSTAQKIEDLAKDLKNGPFHKVFESGMLMEINNAANRLAFNSKSLIMDDDNNICEQFNSVVNKYIGGKRKNLSQRNAYNTRVEAAVISFNSNQYLRAVTKKVIHKSPGKFGKSKRKSKFIRPDEHYGLADLLQDDITTEELDVKKIKQFIDKLMKTDREMLEKVTRSQVKSQVWYTEREHRLTTNRLKVWENIGIEVEKKFGFNIDPAGLLVDDKISYLAASPDGLIVQNFVIEIKCPFSAREYFDIFEAIREGKITYCTVDENNKVKLKNNSDYFYQIQGQLHITKGSTCYCCMYTENWNYMIEIRYENQFWDNNMVDHLCTFYTKCLLPEIVNPKFGKDF
ncbi:unnamed protein product [Macrosiphum euphorbiae]|uniref:YqaJ viral recombinase domain-containing protein n=1 Tax=Macrosiphum euphorbiae TaxID=13131 RepID=A0AAV0Y866_9HEMI|nr:unnamed protein product [Macrosiphum euphorbiae]